MRISNDNIYLSIKHREYDKVYGCNIPINKYTNVFNIVLKKWDTYIKESSINGISVAEIIQNNYRIPYAASADIARSISLSKAINNR